MAMANEALTFAGYVYIYIYIYLFIYIYMYIYIYIHLFIIHRNNLLDHQRHQLLATE